MLACKELDMNVKFCSPLTLKKYTTSKILKCLIQMHIILYTEPNRIIIYDKEINIKDRHTFHSLCQGNPLDIDHKLAIHPCAVYKSERIWRKTK